MDLYTKIIGALIFFVVWSAILACIIGCYYIMKQLVKEVDDNGPEGYFMGAVIVSAIGSYLLIGP